MNDVRLVLFDLDGTLADTAPDLAGAINRMRAARSLSAVDLAVLRPLASHGARGMIGGAFGIGPEHPDFESLRQEFFREYESALCVSTALFPDMPATLAELEARGLQWGIVTNKSARFTDPLIRALGLDTRAACVVSGDTTPFAKPHPAPLQHALKAAGTNAGQAIYVGDDRRDVEAGRAAGMQTVIAAYGYLGNGTPIEEWGADHVISQPRDLLSLIA